MSGEQPGPGPEEQGTKGLFASLREKWNSRGKGRHVRESMKSEATLRTDGEQRVLRQYWENPEAMQTALRAYTSPERIIRPDVGLGENVEIPTLTGPVTFTKEHESWRTNRPRAIYDSMLFSDEFVLVPSVPPAPPAPPESKPRSTDAHANGERDYAFRPGKTVVDLGSGEATGLIDYALQYPETTFIGIDTGTIQNYLLWMHRVCNW